MRRVMRRIVVPAVLAAALAVRLAPAASGQPVPQPERIGDYTVGLARSGTQNICRIAGPVDAQVQTEVIGRPDGKIFISLVGKTWNLAPDSHGLVTLRAGIGTLEKEFRRDLPTRLTTELTSQDQGNAPFRDAFFGGQTLEATFPGGKTYRLTGPTQDVMATFKKCGQQLRSDAPDDPFAPK